MGALVRKYAPIFMLNVDEVYWPSNVDAFMTHMILQKVVTVSGPAGSGQNPEDFYTGPLNRKTLAEQAARLGADNVTGWSVPPHGGGSQLALGHAGLV